MAIDHAGCVHGEHDESCAITPVLRVGPYRFFFYAGDRAEPAHVHVERDANRTKVWLDPVRLQESGGFPRRELARIAVIVQKHAVELPRRWNEYFTN